MKTITLDNVIQSLETMSPEVRVPKEIADKARGAIDRMLQFA
jgi:quinolinate synthase